MKVALPADLVQRAPLVVGEAADGLDAGNPVGKERFAEVERPSLECVIDGPRVLQRRVEAAGVVVVDSEVHVRAPCRARWHIGWSYALAPGREVHGVEEQPATVLSL